MRTFHIKAVVKIKPHALCTISSFLKIVPFMRKREKYGTVGQAKDDSIMLRKKDVIFLPGNWGTNTDTHSQNSQYLLFSTATVVTRTRLIVTLYLYWMSCWVQKLFKTLATTNRLTPTYRTGSLVCIKSTAARACVKCSNGQVTQFDKSPRTKLKHKQHKVTQPN